MSDPMNDTEVDCGESNFLTKSVAIHPSGTPKDLQGTASCKDMRATPKPYGKKKCVGVIRNGVYVDPTTGKPVELRKGKIKDFTTIHVNKIGGLE